MATLATSPFVITVDLDCLPTEYISDYIYHDWDECPTHCCDGAKDPCTCAGLKVNKTIYSKEYDNWILSVADPIADVNFKFDNFGSIKGETTLLCPKNGCEITYLKDKLKPTVENVGTTKFKLKLEIEAINTPEGGPYGYFGGIYFRFELKESLK